VEGHPTVFISYAHDSPAHKAAVLGLAELLLRNGVRVELDQWAADRRDWSAWTSAQLKNSDFTLIVASPEYHRAGDGHGPAEQNRGVRSEAAIIRDYLHRDRARWLPRLLPVVLPGRAVAEIPDFMQPFSADHYLVDELTDAGIEGLLRVLTGQPGLIRPELGALPVLPPRPPALDQPAPDLPPWQPVRLWWQQLSTPLEVSWRADLLPGRRGRGTLELHLVPTDDARLGAPRLRDAADGLITAGREYGLFTPSEGIESGWSDLAAWAVSAGRGLAVHRDGQRSGWQPLPAGLLGAVLDPEDVGRRLAELFALLLALDLPLPGSFAPTVGLEPLDSVREAPIEDVDAGSGRLNLVHPDHIRLRADQALTHGELAQSATLVAEELAIELLAIFRRTCH
jgi:hypothetical protein